MTRKRGHAPPNSNAGNSEIVDGKCAQDGCTVAGAGVLWRCLICRRRTGAPRDLCRRHYEAHKRTFHNGVRT